MSNISSHILSVLNLTPPKDNLSIDRNTTKLEAITRQIFRPLQIERSICFNCSTSRRIRKLVQQMLDQFAKSWFSGGGGRSRVVATRAPCRWYSSESTSVVGSSLATQRAGWIPINRSKRADHHPLSWRKKGKKENEPSLGENSFLIENSMSMGVPSVPTSAACYCTAFHARLRRPRWREWWSVMGRVGRV